MTTPIKTDIKVKQVTNKVHTVTFGKTTIRRFGR